MPSSKKPRKAYKPKRRAVGYSAETIDGAKAIYRRVEYSAYNKLPKGEATVDDMLCIRDVLNTVTVSLFVRRDFPLDKIKDAADLIGDAGEAAMAIINRGEVLRRFVGKGDEVRIITEALAVCGPYIEESLETCPRTFIREWETMRRLTHKKNGPTRMLTLPISQIRKVYERV